MATNRGRGDAGDLLLDWLVGQQGGSTKRLDEVVTWFCRGTAGSTAGVRPWFWLRDMAALGYVDVDRHKGMWAVAPPTAVSLTGPDGLLYLTGGLTRTFLGTLDESLEQAPSADACPESVDRQSVGGIPLPRATFVLPSGTDVFKEVVSVLQTRMRFSPLAGPEAASRLPSVEAPMAKAVGPAMGNQVEQLDPDAVGEAHGRRRLWRPVQWSAEPEPQLYRWRSPRVTYGLYRDSEWWATGRDEGVYRALGSTIDIRFQADPGSETGWLIVPARAQLPMPQERAAVLCSGLSPERSEFVTRYANVPLLAASRIARSLGLMLRILK